MQRLIYKIASIGLKITGCLMLLKHDDTGISTILGAQAIIMSDMIDNRLDTEMQNVMLAKLYKKQFPEEFKDDKQN